MNQKGFIIIMGISGSGKSTLGKGISKELGIPFIDGDDFHPKENVMKMSRGIPLTDDDRWPWLASIVEYALTSHRDQQILACSALKQSYRDYLDQRLNNTYIFIEIDKAEAELRIKSRNDHFMPQDLVQSQLDTLEIPKQAITIDANLDLVEQVKLALNQLAAEKNE